jgi:hypothetical protein
LNNRNCVFLDLVLQVSFTFSCDADFNTASKAHQPLEMIPP